jgi:Domain of unknown function DUF11
MNRKYKLKFKIKYITSFSGLFGCLCIGSILCAMGFMRYNTIDDTSITANSMVVSVNAGGRVSISLRGSVIKLQEIEPQTGSLLLGNNRIVIRSPNIDTWYRLSRDGIEQGYTVRQSQASRIRIRWRVLDNILLQSNRRCILFLSHEKAILQECNLVAIDHDNHQLPAHFLISGNVINIYVDAERASYPIIVDPTFAPIATLTEPTTDVDNGGQTQAYVGGFSGIAISGDGSTVLVGDSSKWGPGIGNSLVNVGVAYFYNYDAALGTWTSTQEIDDPRNGSDDAPDDEFGTATVINSTGTIAAISSMAGFEPTPGRVFLYVLTNGTWQQTQVIDNPEIGINTASTNFGYSMAMSADGNTLLIGAQPEFAGEGVAYIYIQQGGIWNLAETMNDPGNSTNFGSNVALSADGNSALVGQYLYTNSNGNWTLSNTFIDPDDPDGSLGSVFGWSGLAISSNGQLVVIAADHAEVDGQTAEGKVYIYSNQSGSWNLVTTISDPDVINNTSADLFGHSLTLTAAGTTLVIGSDAYIGGHPEVGKAYIYTQSNGVWNRTQELDNPTTDDGYGTAPYTPEFGYKQAVISRDGSVVLIGATGDFYAPLDGGQPSVGTAYLYAQAIDMELAISPSSANAAVGSQMPITFSITNNDQQLSANNINLNISMPYGLNISSINAAGGTCNTGGSNCTLASLAPGQHWNPVITVSPVISGTYDINSNFSLEEPVSITGNSRATATITINSDSGNTNTSAKGGGSGLGIISIACLLLCFVRRQGFYLISPDG